MDEKDLANRIAALPADLKVWFDGPAALPRLLAVVSLSRFTEIRDKLRETGGQPLPGHVWDEMQQRWSHAVSSLIEWNGAYGHTEAGLVPILDHPAGLGRTTRRHSADPARLRRLGKRDYESAVGLSQAWFALDPIRVGLFAGEISILRVKGKNVWVENSRRADIEVLDLLLEQVTVFDPPTPDPESHLIDEWMKANARIGASGDILNKIPHPILEIAWRDAEACLAVQGLSLAETTDLGELTLAQARTCYAFLIMQLRLNEFAAFQLDSPEKLIWGIRPSNLHRALSSRVGVPAASAFIELVKYEKGRSPGSAPLIPHGDLLLIPSEIVSPIAFERTLLRAASAIPSAAGSLGNLLGRRSSRWAQRLRSVPGCRVATELPVKDAAGRLLGDLDLVAWDPVGQVQLIVETKWPVDAATLAEGLKVDATIDKGRAQIARIRACIESGNGTVVWPRDWHVPSDTRASWWVGTAQQLDSRGVFDGNGIGATSLRQVEQLLPAASLADLVSRLAAFPLPRRGVEYILKSMVVQAGDLTVHFKALGLLGDPPVPPAGRRTQHGWT
ncbi:MAG: hypothetical protein KJ817_11805 [Actinobacteria bacterium]|nr:hypothetical protein [Actinomycetota bacterium]